ncbi:MAG: nucleotidyltransferase domain-containing protein [Candidatus Cloacimonadota bacterium]|nr:MAG: nucleotidyltransferase domain-containing protein [Candidatus Cloacimonadota bacterium]
MDKKRINQIIKKYLEILEANNLKVKDVFLFGSCIKGNFDENSDIDLAIVSDDFTGDSIDNQFLLMKLCRKVDISIEPHPFVSEDFTDDNPFAREIIRTGERVKL